MRKFYRKPFALLVMAAALCGLGWGASSPSGSAVDPFALPGMQEEAGAEEPSITGNMQSTVETYALKSFVLVVNLQLPGHWHSYYENPGTVGLPMRAKMKEVNGFKVEGPFYSTPKLFSTDLGFSYGYESPRIAFRVTPENDAPDEAVFDAEVELQMCRDGECMPPETLPFTVKLKKGQGKVFVDADQRIAGIPALGIAPRLKELVKHVAARTDRGNVLLEVATSGGFVPEKGTVYFFSSEGEIFPPASQEVIPWEDGGGFTLVMQRNNNEDDLYPNLKAEEDKPLHKLASLKGILSIDGEGMILDVPADKGGRASAGLAGSAHSGEEAAAGASRPPLTELLIILSSMFFGGLILNLMPCVFPVIGLKVLGFVELGGGDRKKILSHSLAFVVGVLVSFWALTAVLVAVKEAFKKSDQVISWAMWMQEPWVVYGLILLLLALGLSMYGVFEIGVRATGAGAGLQQKKGKSGSFWSGVLATVIATPCSAPVLGSTMPATLALPNSYMVVAFTCMGLGMASPYLVLSAFPSLLKRLPKPGVWMESFKQGVSFLLFGSVAWLAWTYSLTYIALELDHTLLDVYIGFVVFAAAFWVYGRWCPLYRQKKTRVAGLIVALVLCAAGVYMSAPLFDLDSVGDQTNPAGHAETQAKPAWEKWSLKAQQEALEEGRPVFVDFTAGWCLTCQVNKRVAYSDSVMSLFKKYNVLLLKADKTRPNHEIDAEMHRLGRSSVPVNVLHVPGDSTPYITSELLTAGYLEGFLSEKLGGRDH